MLGVISRFVPKYVVRQGCGLCAVSRDPGTSGGVDVGMESRSEWTCHSTAACCVAFFDCWILDGIDEQG